MAADLPMNKGFSSRLRSWGFYVCLGQMVIGLLMLFVATTLSDAFSKFSGVGVGILTIVIALVGLTGLTKGVDHMLTVHVIGAILALSMLFPLRFQVLRNADVDCALAEISLTNSNLNEIAEQQNGRNVNLFNLMGMRMKAMSMTMDRIHSSQAAGIFKSNTTNDTIEHTHYKEFWRVADEGFISEQLELVRESSHKLMEALKEKIAKRAKKVRGKYNEKNLETANVDALDEAIKIAMETASMAMRRTNEHLQNRLPEDGLTILEFEDLINSLNRAMRNLKEVLVAVEDEIGTEGNPLKLTMLESVGGGSKGGHMNGALENAVAIKEAMERQQTDIYGHLDLGDIKETRDSFQQSWNEHLMSRINKTALDERAHLEQLPLRCIKESKQEEMVRLTGLVLIFLHLVSLYIMFSLDVRLAMLTNVQE